MRGNLPHTHGNSLMGATISVFWLDEHRWYTGTVKEFDRVSGWHVVAYEDGEQREEPLNDPQLLWKLGVHVDDVSQRGQSDDMAMHVEQDAAGREPGGKAIAGEVEVSVEAMSDSEGGSEAGGDDADEIQSVEAVQVFPCEDAESDALFEQRGFGVARNDEDDEEVVETYSVERVMAEKDGKFLVRWAGYSAEHDTWEPEDSFVNPLPIELFRSSQAAAGRSADGGSSSASARNECADCGRAFDTPHGLTIHRSKGLCGGGKVPKPVKEPPPLPNADGRYQCLNCGTTFDKPHGLLIHRARHCTGEFKGDCSVTLTEAQVEAAATEERLTLLRDPDHKWGFRGVSKVESDKRPNTAYRGEIPGAPLWVGARKVKQLGGYPSPHEAALAIARALGPELSAERDKEKRNRGGHVVVDELTPEEALRLADVENLTLERRERRTDDLPHSTGFVDVCRSRNHQGAFLSRFVVRIDGLLHVGTFATEEEAALQRARVMVDPETPGKLAALRAKEQQRQYWTQRQRQVSWAE